MKQIKLATTLSLLSLLTACQTATTPDHTASLEGHSAEGNRGIASGGTPINLARQIIIDESDIQRRLRYANYTYEQLFLTDVDLDTALNMRFRITHTQADVQRNYDLGAKRDQIKASHEQIANLQKQILEYRFPLAQSPEGIANTLSTELLPADGLKLDVGITLSKDRPAIVPGQIVGLGSTIGEICWNKPTSTETPLDLFASMSAVNTSCIHATDEAHIIEAPISGLREKLEMLTGMTLDEKELARRNPSYVTDYSKAPHFDQILVSTLELKPDFTGTSIMNALLFHAQRGTQVRLIVPSLLTMGPLNKVDNAFVDSYAKKSPNFQVQHYRFSLKNKDITDIPNSIQRVIHAKVFAGLSQSQPELDQVIMGGRNLRDGFYFKQAADNSQHPELVQYKPETYLLYRDLEVHMKGVSVTKHIADQYMAVWMRDMNGPSLPAVTVPIVANNWTPEFRAQFEESLKTKTYVRSFISVPWADKTGELEDVYAKLFDSAKHSIMMTSPYVRPTPLLINAIKNAVKRGVAIQFISDLDFSRDNVPATTGAANSNSFAQLQAQNKRLANDPTLKDIKPVQIYSWKESIPSILHAKSVLVDEQLLYIGSANLAQRALIQDIESGIFIMGPPVERYKILFHDYFLSHAQPVPDQVIHSSPALKLFDFAHWN